MKIGRAIWSGIAATAIVLGTGLPATGYSAADRSTENPAFRKLDTDRDGFVSREEANKWRDSARAFSEADQDGDSRLDRDEFVKFHSLYQRMQAERYVDDSVITAQVRAGLIRDPEIKGLAVGVKTHKGTVQLSGFVEDPRQVRRAAEIASAVRGVRAVKNNLLVKD